MATRVSSLDAGYLPGDLSVFPAAKDNTTTLYVATNEAETTLKQSLTYAAKIIVVEDTSSFPDFGILRIGPPAGSPGQAELIFYSNKTASTFQNLIRGFAGSRQCIYPVNSHVTSGVMAEYHNAIKDAILQIENDLGETDPNANSLNGILTDVETKILAPRPIFRAWPTTGAPALRVRFQNFSTGSTLRYLWDFGDGSTAIEKSPIHTYENEGTYSVTLNMLTDTGAQGVVTKNNYITVSNDAKQPFFYVTPSTGTAATTEFTFVDQTDGDIVQRYWVFDDGESTAVDDPNQHTITHTYQEAGTYTPSLLVVFANQQLKRVFLVDTITVF